MAEEVHRLHQYEKMFHPTGMPELAGRSVCLVDDGLATGATMEAAVLAARKRKAARVMVAVPVASTNALGRIERIADGVTALVIDPEFAAVGRYYEIFTQVSDAEVVALLKSAA